MHRTQIYLNDREYAVLKLTADRKRTSISDLIRNAIDKEYTGGHPVDFETSLDAIAGLWKNKKINTDSFIRQLRRNKHRSIDAHHS